MNTDETPPQSHDSTTTTAISVVVVAEHDTTAAQVATNEIVTTTSSNDTTTTKSLKNATNVQNNNNNNNINNNNNSRNFVPDPTSIPISIVRSYQMTQTTTATSAENKQFDTNVTVQLFQERMIVTCCCSCATTNNNNKNNKQQIGGGVGTWLLCQPVHGRNRYGTAAAATRQNNNSNTTTTWEVSHLLGSGSQSNNTTSRDDPLFTVYCQRISTLVWERIINTTTDTDDAAAPEQLPIYNYPPRSILFGLTLWHPPATNNNNNRRHEPELFHTTVDVVVKTIIEAITLSSSSQR